MSALGSAAQNGTNGIVNALAVRGNNLYVGGSFAFVYDTTSGSQLVHTIAK